MDLETEEHDAVSLLGSPSIRRGRAKVGSKSKPKSLLSTPYSLGDEEAEHEGDMSVDFSEESGSNFYSQHHLKRSRGRPKGTKNKPGHKAGRPRKSNAEDGDDGSPAKRAQHEAPSAPHSTLGDMREAQQLARSSVLSHAIPGDIPVDPSLMSHRNQHRQIHATSTQQNIHHHHQQSLTQNNAQQTDPTFSGTFLDEPEPGTEDVDTAAAAYFARGRDQSAPQLTSQSTAVSGGNGSGPLPVTTPAHTKYKSTATATTTAGAGEVELGGVVRSLLPKDSQGILPQVSGPFQLIENDGKRRLDGPMPASDLDASPGPVYVYIANYQPVESPEDDYHSTPAALASWKITHPLTSEGKDRQRGPRRCGHCGKLECRGRGGRTWCPDYQKGIESIGARMKGRSPSLAAALLDESSTTNRDRQIGQPNDQTYSALAHFRGESQNPTNPPESETSQQRSLNLNEDVTPQFEQRRDQQDNIADSVFSLIQSILPKPRSNRAVHHRPATSSNSGNVVSSEVENQNHDHVFTGANFGISPYRDPGAPIDSTLANFTGALGNGGDLFDASGLPASVRKVRGRNCPVCGKTECPGRSKRAACPDYKEGGSDVGVEMR